MIAISVEQMDAVERARLENVIATIIERLRSQYPDIPPETELRQMLQPMVEQVSAWKIHSGGFLALHVFACKAIGYDYYTLPGFDGVFADQEISDNLKEEWLGAWMTHLREAKKGR